MRSFVPRRLPLVLAVTTIAGLTLAASQLPHAAAVTADQTVTLPATPATNSVTYSGHAPFNNGQANLLFDDVNGACDPSSGTGAIFRDSHTVNLKIPRTPASKFDVLVRFQISWTGPGPASFNDMRLDLWGPDNKLVASSDGSQLQEGINLTEAKPGVYNMIVCAFQTGPTGQDYTGKVTASTLVPAGYPALSPTLARAVSISPPTYKQFSAPNGVSDDAGEPSIGNNWKTGHTFFTSYTHEYDVAFNDKAGTSAWTLVNNKTADPSNKTSLDPIGFTDSVTGRTFVSQLLFVCSGAAFTDDDFKTITPSEGCGTGINGFDHQTFGGGPFPKGITPLTSYPHAVYYCSQAQAFVLGDATCARSDDGGLTFGPVRHLWRGQCSGLHGHVKVAPDGTAYVPNVDCLGKQGLAVSTDGGATWVVRTIPDSVGGDSDPSVAIAKDGTVYFGYGDGTGRPKIAVSRDRGAHWTPSVNIGASGFGLHNTEFAEVVAGDGDRAAFAFLGTTTRGSTQSETFGKTADGNTFTGAEWHLYVATTYDRGAHWTTVDVTPTDPVQRGCIWNSGGSNDCRNLLDFNDMTIDKTGRVMVAIADGCVGPDIDSNSNCIKSKAVSANGYTQHGAIIRQMSGKGLLAAYDGVLPGSGGPVQAPSGGKTASGKGGGSLASTGATPYLAGLGVLFVIAAAGLRRWRRNHA